MCRHMAYLGEPVTLREAIIEAPHSLYRQAFAPRLQRHGTMNADGFGVGWYPASGPPARYRRAVPIWTDPSFADLARVTSACAVLAAVRCATPGTAHGEEAVAPFADGNWLLSHNGAIDGWPESTASLAASLPVASLLSLPARVDSAVLWALVLNRLRSGASCADAIADTLAEVDAAGVTGRFNLLLTDGVSIAASAFGDTLFWRRDSIGVTVASEPFDDDPGWVDVSDRHVLSATATNVDVRPIRAERIAIR